MHQAFKVVDRTKIVDMRENRPNPQRLGLEALIAKQRVEPDQPAARAVQPIDLGFQPHASVPVETVERAFLAQEEEKKKRRQTIEGYKLGGLITSVTGFGLGIFLYFREPNEPVFLIGLIPIFVGIVLVFYAAVLAPKPE